MQGKNRKLMVSQCSGKGFGLNAVLFGMTCPFPSDSSTSEKNYSSVSEFLDASQGGYR